MNQIRLKSLRDWGFLTLDSEYCVAHLVTILTALIHSQRSSRIYYTVVRTLTMLLENHSARYLWIISDSCSFLFNYIFIFLWIALAACWNCRTMFIRIWTTLRIMIVHVLSQPR